MEAMRSGVVSNDAGDRLVEEVNFKLERVRSGETTVSESEEGYEEFWRTRASEYGLEAAELTESERDGSQGPPH
jgi:CPA1 family monovalent cation:H+ antiporter